MLQFGLRLGERPRQVVTTTPRPIALLKRLMADPATALTRAGTNENALHLSSAFIATVFARYGGTRIGRQELDGEIIEKRADALWTRARMESCRVAAAPPLNRIVVAVDPPASTSKRADACGLVAAGRAEDGTFYVIADEPGRRHGARRDRRSRPHGAGGRGARHPHQVAARRTDRRTLRAGQGEARRRVPGAGR
jgi:phage terminase large subunit-like protein